MEPEPRTRLVTTSSLQTFFKESVLQAIANQRVAAEEETVVYLVNLLTHFSRSEHLFDYTVEGFTLTPLAQIYALSLEARTESERKRLLRRLGDVALFVSGLFSGMFRRRPVDVDYYIAMGGSAYAYLHDSTEGSAQERTLGGIFRELSAGFSLFVDVLAEVGECAHGADDKDVFRMYELWSKTRSKRLEHKLNSLRITLHPVGYAH